MAEPVSRVSVMQRATTSNASASVVVSVECRCRRAMTPPRRRSRLSPGRIARPPQPGMSSLPGGGGTVHSAGVRARFSPFPPPRTLARAIVVRQGAHEATCIAQGCPR